MCSLSMHSRSWHCIVSGPYPGGALRVSLPALNCSLTGFRLHRRESRAAKRRVGRCETLLCCYCPRTTPVQKICDYGVSCGWALELEEGLTPPGARAEIGSSLRRENPLGPGRSPCGRDFSLCRAPLRPVIASPVLAAALHRLSVSRPRDRRAPPAAGDAAKPVSLTNGPPGQRGHDRAGIRIDAWWCRPKVRTSASPIMVQAGHWYESHGRPARTAAAIVGTNSGSAPRAWRACQRSMTRAAAAVVRSSSGCALSLRSHSANDMRRRYCP